MTALATTSRPGWGARAPGGGWAFLSATTITRGRLVHSPPCSPAKRCFPLLCLLRAALRREVTI
ncbi:hypothetical protein GCM10010156_49040 [Planobispora rosea]|uniref:Uncharacterized protein n=1 Tax=Planobispora rosea TaxID=35762 RepID=A0A8J3S409_PLARO|nr:hypothetical protein GCM10010156_49040 [Planobispora rosea]GIH86415.1 hypothetical protein Pro02_48230 [Planobispora rosea]